MITLYQMPISHYCEKVRWAVAYKRLPVKYKNVLPGLHIKPITKMTGQSSVPVINESGNIVHNSADILDYLDQEFPRFLLTPKDAENEAKAREWERFADREIGPAVRRISYQILLDYPEILIPIFGQNGPWYKKFVLKKAYPKIQKALLRAFEINGQSVGQAKETLHSAIDKVRDAQSERETLLDSGFSRADVAVASLFAPFFQVGKYGVDWPESMPEAYDALATEFEGIQPWLLSMYQKYR